jgi:hypothetical protein
VPSKSCNYCSLHPPNMDASIRKMSCLFLYLFMSNYKQVQTSSKHQLDPLTPIACLVLRLDRATCPVNHPTIAHCTLQNMDASIRKMPCLFLYLFMSNCKQAQTSSNHQLLHLAPLARLVFRLDRATHPTNHPTIAHYTLQTWMPASGKMPCLFLHLFMSNCKGVQTSSKHQLLPLAPLT